MSEYIALDVHKHYTFAEREAIDTGRVRHCRIDHARGNIRQYLANTDPGTKVAVEATGNWYWIVEEIEQAGLEPALVHPYKAKMMLACINKTDKLDVHGMNRLQRTGTLPTVWIPPASIRDLRDLPRTRMFLVRERARIKNRIQSALSKYALDVKGYTDVFGQKGRQELEKHVQQLPPQTQAVTHELLQQLDVITEHIEAEEQRIKQLVKDTAEMQRLMTLPGVGRILSVVMALEIGDIRRFASAAHFASYCGLTPRVHASGDKVRFGRLRSDVNRYLKWAYIEAAASIRAHQNSHPARHVVRLYKRVGERRGFQKGVGAVARHLAEATFYMLSRQEDYKEPTVAQRRATTGT
jgi:transposase